MGDSAENQQTTFQPLTKKYPHIKFIIPQAPKISVSMNWGFSMPAWYNIKGNTKDIMNLKEDKEGLLNSADQIKRINQSEINSGVNPQKIMLIGHSQGAALALTIGLTSDFRLAGIVSFCGFLPCRNEIFNYAKPENKLIPFFLHHTYYDSVVPGWVGKQSAQLLKEKGYTVEFEGDYSGNHIFLIEELHEILTKRIGQLLL